mmetsp:Transcript_15849/g.60372  ORF Transcript_15849/g.60372 Transcript_15849/m.60372 type:complete len:107 (-) Transcript_15849:849-1169(-)
MIDGALIATYFGSERCRHFNALFGCAWFNEIQCYSDRDQLSFAYTLTRALGESLRCLFRTLPSGAQNSSLSGAHDHRCRDHSKRYCSTDDEEVSVSRQGHGKRPSK